MLNWAAPRYVAHTECGFHYVAAGYQLLGNAVAASIKSVLQQRRQLQVQSP